MVYYHSSEEDYSDDDEFTPRVIEDDDVVVPNKKAIRAYYCEECDDKKFDTEYLFRMHKSTTHDYCFKCDEDFDTFERHMLHKLQSSKHITCCVCCKEFKSESGLNLHMAQNHKKTSEATCPGCMEKFNTQSGLLQHVENNLCTGGLRRSVAHKGALETQNALQNLRLEETETGGVPLGDVSLSSEYAETETPEIPSSTRSDIGSISYMSSSANTSMLANPPNVVGTSSEKLRWVDKRDTKETIIDERVKLKPEWFDERLNVWICPMRGCNKRYASKVAMEQHVNGVTHQAKNFRCPGCLNRFGSSSALLQHIEAGMCRISKTSAANTVVGGLTASIHGGPPM